MCVCVCGVCVLQHGHLQQFLEVFALLKLNCCLTDCLQVLRDITLHHMMSHDIIEHYRTDLVHLLMIVDSEQNGIETLTVTWDRAHLERNHGITTVWNGDRDLTSHEN